ncbi:MAG TPA: type II secretion system protein GspM [Burkholderiaceae bacterium]|nr:type II secretion system protein GspM [Burkholderiaceae bacterium]
MNALLQRWHAMETRERRLVAIALAVVAGAIVYLVAIEPALNGRAKLQRELPKLRSEAAELAGIASVASQRPVSRRPANETELRRAIEAALGPLASKATVTTSGTSVVVKFERLAYPAVASWASRIVRETGARIESAKVTPSSEPERADVEFGFAR